jgi:hypothetical protein
MFKKGTYPYSYKTGRDKFLGTHLPERSCFYDDLNEKDISEKKYRRAQQVWQMYGIQNMEQFHDLYLKSDMTLLADVF